MLAGVLLAPCPLAAAPAEDLRVPGGEGFLAASLFLPSASGPHPAVVIVQGSSMTPRTDGYWLGLVARFTAQGFAVMIADKRGVGDSPGTFQETRDFTESADDALAQVRLLRSRPDIRPDRIGLVGYSQGGWVAPLAATRSPDVAFVVMVSGPAVTPAEQNLFQREQEWRDAGYSDAEISEMRVYLTTVWTYYRTRLGQGAAAKAWGEAKTKRWFKTAEPFADFFEDLPGEKAFAHPAFLGFRMYAYDPVPVLAQLRVPVLAIYGEKDRHIPVRASVKAARAAFRRGGNRRAEVRVIPDAGHVIQRVEDKEPLTAKSGPAAIFKAPPAPGYWETVTTWLRSQVLQPPGTEPERPA